MQKIVNINQDITNSITSNVLNALQETNKSIPTKYLYDDYGSKLFEEICETDEYYLTRLEKKILAYNAKDIIGITGPEDIFELGSGASKKTKLIINEKLKINKDFTYSSLDISKKALEMGYDEIKRLNKGLNINLFQGDFVFDLHRLTLNKVNRLFLFLGSTIGNFKNDLAITFLTNLRKIMNQGDYLLLGVDMIKDQNIITSAYNDRKGVTKKFNKNILKVINEKYNLNFNQKFFEHQAIFNTAKSQVEMFLKATKEQSIELPNNNKVVIKTGEKILTEISRKFSINEIENIFAKSNLKIYKHYKDENNYYSLFLLEANQTS